MVIVGALKNEILFLRVTPHGRNKEAQQHERKPQHAAANGEMLTLKVRYKRLDGEKSALLEFPVVDDGYGLGDASDDFRFSAAVAAFGMILRGSQHKGDATLESVVEFAESGKGDDRFGYRQEFIDLVKESAAAGLLAR